MAKELVVQLNSEILYTEDVAKLSRRSVATIRYMKATGTGPRWGKLGRRVVYKASDVQQWIDSAFSDGGL